MKRLVYALLSLMLLTSSSRAVEITRPIAFLAQLKTAAGVPVNGEVLVTLRLYTVPTGGTPVWSETKTVSAVNGLMVTALGDTTPFTDTIVFDRTCFVGITAGTDAEMTPRLPVMGAPYALAVPGMCIDSYGRMALGRTLQMSGGNDLVLQANSSAPTTSGDIEFRNDDGSLKARIWSGPGGNDLRMSGGRDIADIAIHPDGRVGICNTEFSLTGAFSCTTLTLTSSRRYKSDIQPLTGALDIISRLQGVSYAWDTAHGGRRDIGFVAEDAAKVVPELVTMEPDGQNAVGMDYAHLTALTVEAIKQLKTENDALRAQNKALSARLDRLERAGKPAPRKGTQQ